MYTADVSVYTLTCAILIQLRDVGDCVAPFLIRDCEAGEVWTLQSR
jgi:hypothetical protein